MSTSQASGKALYDYRAQEGTTNQVSFKAVDDIRIVSIGPAGGWSRGLNPQGASGLYPSDYVEVLAQVPPVPPVPPQRQAQSCRGGTAAVGSESESESPATISSAAASE